ncbi:MAG TPA: FecR domain-containing protein [Flavitalea sp.]|nr:FecR domain-containing protein [Flavitalea sp.]
MEAISVILTNYLKGTITDREQRQLDEWLNESPDHAAFFQQINDPQTMGALLEKMDNYDDAFIWNKILERRRIISSGSHRVFYFPRWMWAAAIFLILGSCVYLYFTNKTNTAVEGSQISKTHDVPPGGNKAILTLSDGSKVMLDDASNGSVARQGHTKVVKLDSGRIAYYGSSTANREIVYNKLQTPRGGQYQLTLCDGSKVWLNAASSITYPVIFSGKERIVSVTGEAYFEVAHNTESPFKVNINNKAQIEVLGTNFNVKAYEEEAAIYTTLLEGSLLVGSGQTSGNSGKFQKQNVSQVKLLPGEQALLFGNTTVPIKVNKNADMDGTIAWKNKIFNFQDKTLKEIMPEIVRWYDLEVAYDPGVSDMEFGGDIPMTLTLSQVLKVLQGAEVHFRMENNKMLHVMP